MQEGSLASILQEGEPIETRFGEKQDWVLNTLYKVNEPIIEIEIRQEDKFLDEFLAIGDSVECRYSTNREKYFIEGWISRVKSDPPQKFTVQIHKVSKIEDDSSQESYEVFLGCIIKNSPRDKGNFSIAKTISKKGLGFVSKEPIDCGQKLYLELLVSGNISFKTPAELYEIEKVDNVNRYNVKFVDTDVLNSRILENFLNEIEKGKAEDYNRENSFWKKNSKIKV